MMCNTSCALPAAGNHEKAVSILQKAIRADAQPPDVLHALLRDLEAQVLCARSVGMLNILSC